MTMYRQQNIYGRDQWIAGPRSLHVESEDQRALRMARVQIVIECITQGLRNAAHLYRQRSARGRDPIIYG